MRSAPLAARQGVLRSVVLVAVVVAALGAPSAQAANVTVRLGVSAGTYAPTGELCALSIPADANGVAVLDAAVAAGCITSYETTTSSFGTYLSCLNDVCGDTTSGLYLTYWSMYENGAYTDYGVDGFRAADGDELTFAYKEGVSWVACMLPTGCLPL